MIFLAFIIALILFVIAYSTFLSTIKDKDIATIMATFLTALYLMALALK